MIRTSLSSCSAAFGFAVALLVSGPALAKDADPCARSQDQLDAVDAQLLQAWKADKEDRETSNPETPKNDARRVKDVAKLDEKGWVCSPLNAFHAAWVLQRSPDPAHVQKAHEYAKKAMQSRIQNGAWLSAITYDLLQVTYGRPQRFATQMVTKDGRTCLYPVAKDATDEERAAYQIRPIAETYRVVLDANGLNAAVASPESLDLEQLWCTLKAAPGVPATSE